MRSDSRVAGRQHPKSVMLCRGMAFGYKIGRAEIAFLSLLISINCAFYVVSLWISVLAPCFDFTPFVES